MKAYSQDLRQRVLAAVDAGTPRSEVVRQFQVSLATLKRLLKQRQAQGHVQPKTIAGPSFRIGIQQHDSLQAQLRAAPDATLEEHCRQWQAQQDCSVSTSTMSRANRAHPSDVWVGHAKKASECQRAQPRSARTMVASGAAT